MPRFALSVLCLMIVLAPIQAFSQIHIGLRQGHQWDAIQCRTRNPYLQLRGLKL